VTGPAHRLLAAELVTAPAAGARAGGDDEVASDRELAGEIAGRYLPDDVAA